MSFFLLHIRDNNLMRADTNCAEPHPRLFVSSSCECSLIIEALISLSMYASPNLRSCFEVSVPFSMHEKILFFWSGCTFTTHEINLYSVTNYSERFLEIQSMTCCFFMNNINNTREFFVFLSIATHRFISPIDGGERILCDAAGGFVVLVRGECSRVQEARKKTRRDRN